MKKIFTTFLLFAIVQFCTLAQSSNVLLRRPVSSSSPMYLMHIDTWNYPDPQKIIDLIPADVKPYVVMNISLSISHDSTGRFNIAEYGYETVKSWLRVCAENRMWATVQVASGGMTQAQFSEKDLTVYEDLYKTYPNLLGFNYAEQFWGYDAANDPISVAWNDRITHFADLLKLSNKYGGFVIASWCGNQYSPNINPIGMLKRNPAFASACQQYTKNFILCEKYTQNGYQYDMESICLGAYLSGFSGNYGIRYDDTGWTDSTGTHTSGSFTMGTAATPILEHAMLTGETVVDGPELIWTQCFEETSPLTTTNGYTARNWHTFPQFDNVSVDLFRKVLDGTVRIPTREELIKRTKVAIINNVNSGPADSIYSSPQSLFQGLYSMDGNYENNKTFFKKSGRYPTIPTVYQLSDATANSFSVKINRSDYNNRWPSLNAKTNELDNLFPLEYSGDIYAGRHENGWVVYNPYKTVRTANGRIPFKYNTADSMELVLSQYTAGVIKETSNQLKIYLNNYDNKINPVLKTDVIKIYGSTSQPTWSYTDRANHQASSLSGNWSGSVFTLTIMHNGPLDIAINCSGTAIGRLTTYTPATLAAPDRPAAYAGSRQYEAEIFDYKNISGIVKNGYSGSIRNYTGQGYLQLGTSASAAVRKTVNVLQPGAYLLQTKYSVTGDDITNLDLYVNDVKVATPTFTQTSTASDWKINAQAVVLRTGVNTLELRAKASASVSMNIDNFVLSAGSVDMYHFNSDTATTVATNPAALVTTLKAGTAGVVSYTDALGNRSNALKAYSNGIVNGTGVIDLDLFAAASNYSITWKEFASTAGGKKAVLLRGSGSSSYATGMKQGYLFVTENNGDNTVSLRPYIVSSAGINAQANYTSSFTVTANSPTWYRATAFGNTLKFECSKDSISWEGGKTATFTDNTYGSGTSQLLWGFGANNFSWAMDNITYDAPKLSANIGSLEGFSYAEGKGPSSSQRFIISGQSLKSNVIITAPSGYEISLSDTSVYKGTFSLSPVNDSLPAAAVYVRLKSGLSSGIFKAAVTATDGENVVNISVSGSVTLQKIYSFTDDVAGIAPTDPPAANITTGTSNGATAGVVSRTDLSGTSNYLKAYSGGARNATGALNLDLFPTDASNYSVSWKQVLEAPAAGKEYKNGVLLRGTNPAGTATTGYVQGLKQGYVFIVYNSGVSSPQFRIYRSTAATSLTMLVNASAGAAPVANKPMWYRATATGTNPVTLKLEYSTDSLTWSTGAQTSDAATPTYTSGSTQFVWGLAAASYDFYIDNITMNAAPQAADITVSDAVLSGFASTEGSGPSASKSFTVSGAKLTDSLLIIAPATFEVSKQATSGYANTLALSPTGGNLDFTTVNVRMKQGLSAADYGGNLTFSYASQPSGFDKVITLKGSVVKPNLVATTSAAINDLGYVLPGGNAAVRSFFVSGSRLAQNVVVTAPANFEISLAEGAGYTSAIGLTPTDSVLATTTVYVRMTAGLVAGIYTGTINLSSLGADNKSLDVSGNIASNAFVSTSATAITGLGYSTFAANNSAAVSFIAWGHPLAGDITITAPANFEISRTASDNFDASVTLGNNNGTVDSTIIFVRLKTGLAENKYQGTMVISSVKATDKTITVAGIVTSNRIYSFSQDIASSIAQNPPAANITIGTANGATAGIASYTDAQGASSNRFRAYTGGTRNGTGVANLNLFPTDATDYSVTWKQNIGTSGIDYKAGCLLRGTGTEGTATTGYVQGMKNGYVFIAYNAGSSRTEFRIYRSTSATSLNTLVNTAVSTLIPAVGQNIWYRASAKGNAPVNLKFEYSTDSINWNIGSIATDAAADAFATGSTQLVWGLSSPGFNFYMDNITYRSLVPVPQTLVMDTIPIKTAGDTAFQLHATASSGRPVAFTSSDTTTARIAGDWVQILKKGTVTITANQPGDDVLLPAADTKILSIQGKLQHILFDSISPKLIGDTAFPLTATASSGLPVIYSITNTGIATIDNGYVTMLTPGTDTIIAIQPGNNQYDADTASRVMVVNSLHIALQYSDGDGGNGSNNVIKPYFKIVNNGASPVALQQLTVRYWFTPENFTGTINSWVDYAQMGNSKVAMQYVPASPARQGGYGYMQYSFLPSAGNVTASGNTGVIQTRFANGDWSVFSEADDYSYVPAAPYASNDKITIYRNGVLVWGTEPPIAEQLLIVKAYTQSKSGAKNTIGSTLQLNNEGNQPIAYSDLKVRYWFTRESSSLLNYWIDYAKIGNDKVSAKFVTVPSTTDSADTYIEFSFASSLGSLYPKAGSGDINYRIAKQDWSAFDQRNDYSYRLPSVALSENTRVTVYNGTNLIYGTEPATGLLSSQSIRLMQHTTPVITATSVYPNPAKRTFNIVPASGVDTRHGIVVKITNLSGQVVYIENIREYASGPIQVNLIKDLPPGMYFVSINNEQPLRLMIE
ncbi:glycoside hydrolase family 98 domain-containing protein [Pinibacter soli]|uniref:Glycoside hydrolase family 98 domain-containing protein n=1 Tax=Pinibacter soli TaxID=3044211 RepID=A0ABT6RG61_9BACT|nr:glycoside hydrolase family 98 domain-containing protein [Pinibacter soli]MDI3320864.1 glycoside hydrolase family 98 domain-containing protein [Pinibacter soli]